jgi:hypothetical protein
MFDVIAYLDSRGIEYVSRGKNVSSGWVGIRCVNPRCGDETNHLGVNIATGNISCWKCSLTGNPLKLITLIDKCTFAEAREIRDEFDNSIIMLPKERVKAVKVMLPKNAVKPLPEQHRKYLESRNFDPDLLTEKYDLYGCGIGKEYKYRIILPVYLDKQLVTFLARAIVKAERRYDNCPIEKSVLTVKESLYNFDTVKETALVVEGPTDVWRMGDGCCATFGTQFTTAQVALLRKCKNVFVMYDKSANEEAEQLCYDLSGVINHVEQITITDNDPAEMQESDVRSLRKELKL